MKTMIATLFTLLTLLGATTVRALDPPKQVVPDVRNLEVADTVLTRKPVMVSFGGVYAGACDTIVEPVQVKRVGNIFILLPVEQQPDHCPDYSLRYFQKKVNLGPLKAGQYGVVIGQKSDRAIYRRFSVLSAH